MHHFKIFLLLCILTIIEYHSFYQTYKIDYFILIDSGSILDFYGIFQHDAGTKKLPALVQVRGHSML